MTETTTNHGWEIPEVNGSKDVWGQILNDFFDGELDEEVPLKGSFLERPAAGGDVSKLYLATDRRIVYYNDGTSWEAVYGLGTENNPVPGTSHFESLGVEDSRSNRQTIGTTLDHRSAGTVLGAKTRSYTDQFRDVISSMPSERTKPVVVVYADRVDDSEKRMFDEMSSRWLPWGLGLTPGGSELEQSFDHIAEIMDHGGEIGYYTGDGRNWHAEVDNLDDLYEIGISGKRDLEDYGFNASWMSPRGTQGFDPPWTDSAQARAMESLFAATAHAGVIGSQHVVSDVGWHINKTIDNVEDWTTDVEQGVEDDIQNMIDAGAGATYSVFVHPRAVHQQDNWDVFTDFLDFIEQKRNNGDIHVCTPTMAVSSARDADEYDLVGENSPHSSDFSDSLWAGFGGGTPDIGGAQEYYILGVGESTGVETRRVDAARYCPGLMLEFEARAPDGVTHSNRPIVRTDDWYFPDGTETGFGFPGESLDVSDSWETKRVSMAFPRATRTPEESSPGRIAIYSTEGDEVWIKNIKLYPI